MVEAEGTRTGVTVVKGKVLPRKVHKGPEGESRYLLFIFFNPDTRCGWVVNSTPRPLYPRERDTVPIL